MLNYTFVRSSIGAIFIDTVGAKNMPKTLVLAVISLSVVIKLLDYFQKSFPVQSVFLGFSITSSLLFSSSALGSLYISPLFSHLLLIWKEVYIVVLVHLFWGYSISFFKESTAKLSLSVIAIAGSIGGIVGGIALKQALEFVDTSQLIFLSSFFEVFIALVFFSTITKDTDQAHKEIKHSPIKSLKGKWKIVILICALVVFSQVNVSIVDFLFHIEISNLTHNTSGKAMKLGSIYSYLNALTLVFKIILIPSLLYLVDPKNIQKFIPLTLLAVSLIDSNSIGSFYIPAIFITFKAVDYSVFSITKEFLYYDFNEKQKYGVKYIADMLLYRSTKAISAIILIFVQSPNILMSIMRVNLLIWFLSSILFITKNYRPNKKTKNIV